MFVNNLGSVSLYLYKGKNMDTSAHIQVGADERKLKWLPITSSQ